MGALAVVIAVLELWSPLRASGALILTLALWTAVAQGSVAAAAAAELTHSRWLASVKPELLAAARLLPPLALLFLLLGPQLGLYRWAAEPHAHAWLNRPFFLARNVVLLAAVAATAWAFAARSSRGDPSARPLAVVYLLLFAVSQTLVAFDWVMSLSWPWVSSMLGMYFAVEALYLGLAGAGVLFAILGGRGRGAAGAAFGAAGHDVGLLLFGFSVLWGGLFFAQFMLLWYGNLPEEVGFIATRMAASPTRELGVAFIALCFGVPFAVLISRAAKRSRPTVALVSAAILCGLAAERLFLAGPELPLRPGVLVVENLLMVVAWWMIVARDRRAEPGVETRGGGE
jgi:hypothetical protein